MSGAREAIRCINEEGTVKLERGELEKPAIVRIESDLVGYPALGQIIQSNCGNQIQFHPKDQMENALFIVYILSNC